LEKLKDKEDPGKVLLRKNLKQNPILERFQESENGIYVPT
jgi:hypothetical protein